MANYQLFVEYTKTDDLRCISCSESIRKGTLTIGCLETLMPNKGEYYHFKCFFSKSQYKCLLKSEDPNFPPFEGYESIKAKDKEKIVKSIMKLKETLSNENEGKTQGCEDKSPNSNQNAAIKQVDKITTQKKSTDRKTKHNGEGSAIQVDYKEEPFMYKLSAEPLRYAKIISYKNKVSISIDEYHVPPGSNRLRSSFSGVIITDQEWQKLGRYKLKIDEAIKAITKVEEDLTEPKEKKRKLSHDGNSEEIVSAWKLSSRAKLLLKRKTGDVRGTVLQFKRGVFTTSESGLPSDWDYFEITTDQWSALHQHRDDINCDLDEHFDVYSYDF